MKRSTTRAVLIVSSFAVGGRGQIADAPWPKFQHDVRNTGCSSAVGPAKPHVKSWSNFAGYSGGTQVLVDEQGMLTVYWGMIGNPTIDARPDYHGTGPWPDRESWSRLERYDADGNWLWGRRVALFGISAPCLDVNNRIYVATGTDSDPGGRIYAYTRDGRFLWRSDPLDVVWFTHPTIGPNGSVFHPTEWGLFAVTEGRVDWVYRTVFDYQCPSIASDGSIYAGRLGLFSGGSIIALGPDGSLRWSYDTGGSYGTSLAEDGTIYATAYRSGYRGELLALNTDGSLTWSRMLEKYSLSHPAVGKDGTIYLASFRESDPNESGILWAIAPDGSEKWRTVLPRGADAPVVVDGADNTYVVLWRSLDPLSAALYSFDGMGLLRWTYDLGMAPTTAGLSIGRDGTLHVFAHKEGDPEPAVRILTLGDADDPTLRAVHAGP